MLIETDALVFRVVLIGDSSVGKTSIVNSFLHKNFNANEQNTIGAAHESYTEVRDGFRIELQIWDTAGEEKFKSLGPIYYRQAAAALLVFDMSNHHSFESLPGWVENFQNVAGTEAIVVVVGNKIDLDQLRVTNAEAEQWCKGRGFDFVPASAKLGTGVADVFDVLLTKLAATTDTSTTRGAQRFVAPPQADEKGGCC
jgi:small GTP-binding protein